MQMHERGVIYKLIYENHERGGGRVGRANRLRLSRCHNLFDGAADEPYARNLRGRTFVLVFQKSIFQETMAFFGQKLTFGSKNDASAPRTMQRCPLEVSFVVSTRHYA